jgi:D-threo-aldose 1-dehydrogenase
VLTTKVGRTLHRPADPASFDRAPWTGGLNFEVRFDYSYDGIMQSYAQCLQRLGLDSIDALVIHDLDPLYHGDGTAAQMLALEQGGIRALEELKGAGQIKAFGVGINMTESLEPMVRRFDLDFAVVAMPYTLLDQSSLHTGMAACAARGTSVIIGAPFASGILATGSKGGGKYGYAVASAEIQAKARGLEAVCQAHGVALSAAALQFPLAHPAVVSIIPGASHAGEVVQNIAAFSAKIPEAFWTALKAGGLIDADAPIPAGPGD